VASINSLHLFETQKIDGNTFRLMNAVTLR